MSRSSLLVQAKRPAAFMLLGPAFVAAIAYVDPGNVAANLTGGARFGYLLVWVIVLANIMAAIVQYQSAKLGIVTGHTLPALIGTRLGTGARRAFWVQAELIAVATDLAEIIGGAIALNLLFQLPLFVGGLIVGVISILLLATQNRYGQRPFESIIIALLAIIAVGFTAGLVVNPPDAGATARGLLPHFEGTGSVLLAASILGATVMPHAIYVHSAFARDRHGHAISVLERVRLLKVTRIDVIVALGIAGLVNLGMLLLAAVNLQGVANTDTIEGAHAAIGAALGPGIALTFAIGLLASGLASTSVGAYAGATIMEGLLHRRIPLLARRIVTLIPALALLAIGVDPTAALVVSQIALSFGIPFALIPLMKITNDRAVMGEQVNGKPMRWALGIVVTLVVTLNLALIGLTITGG